MKSGIMAAAVAAGLIVTSNASLAQSSDAVLQRLEKLENENAALRDRVRRLEGSRSSVPAKSSQKPLMAQAMVYKTMPVAVSTTPLAPTWGGLYVGASTGWGFFRSHHAGSIVSDPGGDTFVGVGGQTTMPLTGSGNGNGLFGDFRAGYNLPISSQILAGLQLEGTLSEVSAGQSARIGPCDQFCVTTFNRSDVGVLRIDWMASVLGRLGGTFGGNYLYGIGGWTFARLRSPLVTQAWAGNHADFGIAEKTFSADGATIGAGWERKLDSNWSANIEYRYTRFSDARVGTGSAFQGVLGGASASDYRFASDLQAVRVGVNYRPDMSTIASQ